LPFFRASAANLNLSVNRLHAETRDVSVCDSAVSTGWTSAFDLVLLGLGVSEVTIGDIAPECSGATLKVTLTGAGGLPLGPELTRVVDAQTEVFSVAAEHILALLMEEIEYVLVGPWS
jgi:hypothetical protein